MRNINIQLEDNQDAIISIVGNNISVTPIEKSDSKEKQKNKSPFDRVEREEIYYYIENNGVVEMTKDFRDDENFSDGENYECANYCTDRKILEKRALQETLHRLLWRYQKENDKEIEIDNYGYFNAWVIYLNIWQKKFSTCEFNFTFIASEIAFSNEEMARKAISDIVIPFMKKHNINENDYADFFFN